MRNPKKNSAQDCPSLSPFNWRMFCKIRPCPASPLPYGSPPAPTAAAVPAAETPRPAPRWAPRSPPRCCQRCRRWPWRHRGRVAGDRILAAPSWSNFPKDLGNGSMMIHGILGFFGNFAIDSGFKDRFLGV